MKIPLVTGLSWSDDSKNLKVVDEGRVDTKRARELGAAWIEGKPIEEDLSLWVSSLCNEVERLRDAHGPLLAAARGHWCPAHEHGAYDCDICNAIAHFDS